MKRRPRSPHFKIASFFLALVVLALGFFFKKYNPKTIAASASIVTVDKVYDGDTFHTSSGEKVRMIGIDTPEMHDSQKLTRDVQKTGKDAQTIKQMGRKAKRFVEPLINGQEVRLEFDVQQRDKYGRLLAYVYLKDGTFLNRYIVDKGYAALLTIPPNVRFAEEFKKAFENARAQHLGLWEE